ncbi:hypothetical protein [Streptomyces californicus]|uniref:hypothetical protein n=1 Tax=Streptomyces californicus TaxID=67351 RepID=UPI00381DBDE8
MTGTSSALRGGGAPTVDPQACNALTSGPAGLLVPRTTPSGLAPGGAVGTSRSVDIDVTDTGGTDCPDTWQIGARLSPVHGETGGAAVNLPAGGAWVNTTGAVVLPEPGVYELTVTGRGQICGTAAPTTNVWITLGMQIDGVGVIWSDMVVQHQLTCQTGTQLMACFLGQGSITRRFQSAGGQVVRAVGSLSGTVAPGSTISQATLTNPYAFFHKISD